MLRFGPKEADKKRAELLAGRLNALHEGPVGALYVYQMDRLLMVKVGWSTSPARRLASLEYSLPTKLEVAGRYVDVTQRMERHLHQHLRRHRSRGEWYWPTKEFAQELCANLQLLGLLRRGQPPPSLKFHAPR